MLAAGVLLSRAHGQARNELEDQVAAGRQRARDALRGVAGHVARVDDDVQVLARRVSVLEQGVFVQADLQMVALDQVPPPPPPPPHRCPADGVLCVWGPCPPAHCHLRGGRVG